MVSLEALWTVRFGLHPSSMEGGVIVIESGRLFGGDSIYAYSGKFELQGDKLTGTVAIIRHNFNEGMGNIYGGDEDRIELEFEADRVGDDNIAGILKRAGYPNVMVLMERLEALP